MRKFLLATVVALIGHYQVSLAQSTCTQTLRLAQSVYDQGRLQELPNLLENCLKTGFNDQEKVNAYKLLTLTYIYLEEPEKADQTMLALLNADNEFAPNEAVDPAEFVALYKTFRTYPIYRIGLKGGGIASMPTVVSSDYAFDGTAEYTRGYGFNLAIVAEIPLIKKFRKFTLNPELVFQVKSFNSTNLNDSSALESIGKETYASVALPVSLQYNIYEKGIKRMFYASLGVMPEYLLSANKNVQLLQTENSPVEAKSFSLLTQRNKFNLSAIGSLGYKRKIGTGYLVVELRYQMGLRPMLTVADTYENLPLILDYKSMDGIFKLNSLSLSLGYILNHYHPIKLKNKN